MCPIGGDLTGERQGNEVPWLERERGSVEDGGLVGLQPEQLGSDVEAGREVPGPRMDGPVAEPLADRLGLPGRPVVAVDQPGPTPAGPVVDQDDRRALPGQPDRADVARATDAARLEARTRSARAPIAAERQARPSCSAQPSRGERVG